MFRTRTLPRAFAFAGLALATCVALPADASGIKTFRKLFGSENSWERGDAIKGLDPNDPKAYKELTRVLLGKDLYPRKFIVCDWYLRDVAIEVLSGAFEKDVAKQMLKDLKGTKAMVAEGIALAMGKSGDPTHVKPLTEALTHKDWRVRRSAALALKLIPAKQAIDPLITCWEKEAANRRGHFRVWVRCIEALEAITQQKDLKTPGEWKDWWEANKDSFEVGKVEEKEDGKTSTVLRGVNLTYDTRGKGNTLLVLPEYGMEDSYLRTYLRNLEDTNRIIYMSLPGVNDFKPKPPPEPGLPLPKYPIKRITDAFVELIKKLGSEDKIKKGKIKIFAHGITAWIAMKFAAEYPSLISHLILCAPHSSGEAWSKGNDRHVKRGQSLQDIEEEHFAKSRILIGGKSQYEAKSDAESLALTRKGFSIYFADTRDSEIESILGPRVEKKTGDGSRVITHKAFRPMGGVLIPSDFKLFALPKVQVPTLILVGKYGEMTSFDDCAQIQKHYPRSKMVKFMKSSRMPFIEENTKFVKILRAFLN